MNRIILSLIFLFSILKIDAQEYFPNNESVQNKNNNYTAFTNAKIFVTPTQIIEKGTLIIQNGKVIGAGPELTIPKNCKIINLEGLGSDWSC
jgi:hypothetical protein